MLVILKLSDTFAQNIHNASRFELHSNKLKIINEEGGLMVSYTLPLSEEHSKRFFDILLGNLSIGNYVDIDSLLKNNFKDKSEYQNIKQYFE